MVGPGIGIQRQRGFGVDFAIGAANLSLDTKRLSILHCDFFSSCCHHTFNRGIARFVKTFLCAENGWQRAFDEFMRSFYFSFRFELIAVDFKFDDVRNLRNVE